MHNAHSQRHMHTAYIRSDFVHCKIWEKFSGCHYACNLTKNWSSFIKSCTHFLSKISLYPCVDYFTKGIQKFVPYNALFSYKSTLKIFRTLEKPKRTLLWQVPLHFCISTSLMFLKICTCKQCTWGVFILLK